MGKKQEVQKKHTPMRTCIVTREKKAKAELIRLVRTENGEVKVDLKGKLKGRGANICPDLKVLEEAIKNKVIERALKLGRKLTKDEAEKLREEFAKALEEREFRPKNQPVSIRVHKKELEKVKKSQ